MNRLKLVQQTSLTALSGELNRKQAITNVIKI